MKQSQDNNLLKVSRLKKYLNQGSDVWEARLWLFYGYTSLWYANSIIISEFDFYILLGHVCIEQYQLIHKLKNLFWGGYKPSHETLMKVCILGRYDENLEVKSLVYKSLRQSFHWKLTSCNHKFLMMSAPALALNWQFILLKPSRPSSTCFLVLASHVSRNLTVELSLPRTN